MARGRAAGVAILRALPAALPILLACPSRGIAWRGPAGASVHLRAMAAGFAAHGYAVEAWMRRLAPGAGPEADDPGGVSVHEAPRGRLPGVLRRDPRRDLPVDAAAMRKAVSKRPAALLYERWSLLADLGPHPDAPWVLEVNAPLAWEAALFEGVRPGRDLVAWEERSLQAADRVLVVSEALADYVQLRGVDPARILLEPNGAPTPAPRAPTPDSRVPTPESRLPSPATPRLLGYAGTFKPWQGLRTAGPALAELAGTGPITLQLWGDGPDKPALLRAAADAGVAIDDRGWGTAQQIVAARRTWWAAWVPLKPWPGGRDLRALEGILGPAPSRWFSPLKEAEAAAAGVPIWRGYGSPEPALPAPSTWNAIAGRVLESVGLPSSAAPGLALEDRRGTIGAPLAFASRTE